MSHLQQWNDRIEHERAQLQSGIPPKPRFESRLQGTAARLLLSFFALMVGLTLLSRAADGVTTPRVKVDTTHTGILTQRVTGRGTIQPLGDLDMTLPSGILVLAVEAERGQQVTKGDTLLLLDTADLKKQITALEEKIRILDLRIEAAQTGQAQADTDAILEAQRILAERQEDLTRLSERHTREEGRATTELETAQADWSEAQAKYDLAIEKAIAKIEKERAQGAKETEKAVKSAIQVAEEQFASVQESATQAIQGAEAELERAGDAVSSENERLDDAVERLNLALTRLSDAQTWLQTLLSLEIQDSEAIAAAQTELAAAQGAVNGARAAVDSAGGSNASSGTLKRARENLAQIKARWEEKETLAQEKLAQIKAEEEAKLTVEQEPIDVSNDGTVLSANSAVEAAEQTIKTLARGTEDKELSHEDQLLTAQRAIEEAERAVLVAGKKANESVLADEDRRKQTELEVLGYSNERRTLTQSLQELRKASISDGRLTAPVSGVVQHILEGAGRTQEGSSIVSLSRSDEGFHFSVRLAQKETETLSIGEKAQLSYLNEGEQYTLEVEIATIGVPDDEGNVMVTIPLPEGIYPTGGAGNLEITRRSKQYDTCLPLSALRREGKDGFVLVLRETKTVMGTELVVAQIPVEVLAQDSEYMAIRADGLRRDDKIVLSATKPVNKGDRVRLAEEVL